MEITKTNQDINKGFSSNMYLNMQPTVLDGMCVDSSDLDCTPLREEDGVGFVAESEGKYIIVDCFGCTLTKEKFDKISFFKDNTGVVMQENRYGFINKTCDLVIPCDLEGYAELPNHRLLIVKEDKWGVVNTLTATIELELSDKNTVFKTLNIEDSDLELLSDNWLPKKYM